MHGEQLAFHFTYILEHQDLQVANPCMLWTWMKAEDLHKILGRWCLIYRDGSELLISQLLNGYGGLESDACSCIKIFEVSYVVSLRSNRQVLNTLIIHSYSNNTYIP